ncbi:MAG: xanthine dehydrogenase family protein molybdopterin-binding subunit [Acidobacteria bacterium]|nr:xanthine dehydrogenase family protein molybdopterin-binding subunit [Acidobacteriota bacterium]
MGQTTILNRRTFLKTSAAGGGGLVLGLYLPSFLGMDKKAAAATALFEPNVWLKIGTDDSITIITSQLEMGQGVMTAMPMLVAEELDVDWNKVRTEWAPADRAYGNPQMGGGQVTAGSRSTRGYWKPLREAGAAGRAMLVTAAAQTWGVPEDSCSTAKGEVIHQASGRRLRYGALVEKAATLPVPKQVSLKDRKNFRLLGQPLARLDIPEKVNGSAVYGMDVKVPDMLVARVVRCPVFGGKVSTWNADKTKAVPGVRHVVPISSGVAVVADSFWAATRGVRALEIKWDEGANAKLSNAEIRRQFAEMAQKTGAVARNDGDVAVALSGAARTLDLVYEVPYLAHACMEPMNCTAAVRADRCDVWVPTQSQTSAHEMAAKVTGLPLQAVKVHTTYLGGGFGRRGEADFVADAVETSKAIGQPVKVIWTREDDMQHDFYRPATYVRFWAALDGSGKPVAWMQRIVQPSLFMSRNPDSVRAAGGIDRTSIDGAAGLPYNIPNLRVEYVLYDPGIPVGFWRSVGNSVNGYVTEAFFDEVAAAAGKDPYELRRQLLDKAPRHKAVLELAAEKAGWGQPLPKGRFRGIAVHESFGSFVAQVAEVAVAPDGNVRVHRVVCAVDCGEIINPDTIKAQMEGGIIYGLTAALQGEITIENGRVAQSNFHDYPMLRLNEAPETEVYIVPSTESPGGIGEPGTPPIAAAVVNALYAATGKRIRRLPIRAEELRTA